MQFRLVQKVYAQCNPGDGGVDLGECLKLSDSTPVREVYTNPAFLVNLVVRNLFIVAGIILVIMFFMAGYKFILKGKEGVQEAQQLATNALVGFIVMFAAYWIVQIIALSTGADIAL